MCVFFFFSFFEERQWREGVVSDQENWVSCGAKPRSWRQVSGSQDQGRMVPVVKMTSIICYSLLMSLFTSLLKGRTPLRRPPCKTHLQQRPRSEYDDCDETEFTYFQRGRGNSFIFFKQIAVHLF